MKEITVKLTFLEPVLGTAPSDKDIYSRFIGDKAPDAPSLEEEVAAIGADEITERGTTVFPRDKQSRPIIWNYQVEGFFKSACGFLNKVPNTLSSKVKAYKKTIDGRIFVEGPVDEDNPTGRMIPIADAFPIDICERPLRASTAQGERVSLARSEEIPAGASITFTVKCWVDSDIELVKEWLDYGRYNGLCQWRNSGRGRFSYIVLEEK